jgi:Helix-turn-helix of DDE superfamily endonuclease
MKWNILASLEEEKFRRLTGIKRATFDKIVEILTNAQQVKKKKNGRNNKLYIESMLLMTLEYLREYWTYFHISQSYGGSESASYKVMR